MKLKLTRKGLIMKAAKRPLESLSLYDVRGRMRDFDKADVVCVSDQGKTRIIKDRQGDYDHLPRDERGLVDTSLLSNAGSSATAATKRPD